MPLITLRPIATPAFHPFNFGSNRDHGSTGSGTSGGCTSRPCLLHGMYRESLRLLWYFRALSTCRVHSVEASINAPVAITPIATGGPQISMVAPAARDPSPLNNNPAPAAFPSGSDNAIGLSFA